MKKNLIYGMIVLLTVVFAGCTVQETTTGSVVSEEIVFDDDLFSEDATPVTEPVVIMEENDSMEEVPEVTEEVMAGADITLNVVEGDLVELKPSAEDPDGDKLTFTYSAPLNTNGKWQTNEGDAGKYLITVTADDGNLKSSQDVLIIVKPANKAPTVECPEAMTINEGDELFIDCNIFDVDGQDGDISVNFAGWVKTPIYRTTYEDAGEHTVLVSAEDLEGKTGSAEIIINVVNVNREPYFDVTPDDFIVMEGDLITVDYDVTDPDNDQLDVTYSEPFNDKGVWQTKIGDAGTYNAFVAVDDGQYTVQQEFEVVVQLVNTAPALKAIPDIKVKEGETVNINVDATDREGDELFVEYSGWMTSDTRKTNFDDARPNGCDEAGCTAEYEVLVTVSDGFLSASQIVNILVTDVDRAPVFKGILGN